VRLVDREHDRLADLSFRIALCLFQKRFAHHPIAPRREHFPLKVFDFEILILFVDDHCPAFFGERLGRDIRPNVEYLRQAQEWPFRVFDRVDCVISVRRKPGAAPEVIVRVAQLPRLQRFRVLRLKLLDVDVFQICFWCRS
jgi:hypothetical protein